MISLIALLRRPVTVVLFLMAIILIFLTFSFVVYTDILLSFFISLHLPVELLGQIRGSLECHLTWAVVDLTAVPVAKAASFYVHPAIA